MPKISDLPVFGIRPPFKKTADKWKTEFFRLFFFYNLCDSKIGGGPFMN